MDGLSSESLQGAKLRISLPDSVVYTGIVHSVDMSVPRLSLKVTGKPAIARHVCICVSADSRV